MIVSLSLITNIPLPTIGRSIGDDAPLVFRRAPRKTSGRSTWGRFKRRYWGVLLRYRHGPFNHEEVLLGRCRTIEQHLAGFVLACVTASSANNDLKRLPQQLRHKIEGIEV
ncbi:MULTISPECIES: hypothetical protein [unclassified Rhizobium]|uniref:hypothetical protein n=1 Tax=unclassified Rhizobium TaxID=2613769 RepID=UPI001ADAE6D2|nr:MULTISPECIES: hypothetical protein [unclassified Rhizobium]MBO9096865.1 hypothetical protein [Rhizobium sp. L58/93]MBO9167108.1 hypothetical protein [Rhizobium sp. L245/93]QXZ88221.1 hypothetical protein J5287_31455 [Rhizobium sp. K1/93]QXZ94192.1 hypothetical protein J5280_30990 [Rhizobium sp. K15/93]QYA05710.1 hypothetical protein J5278_29645 [Rhizobium sp. B21/90]